MVGAKHQTIKVRGAGKQYVTHRDQPTHNRAMGLVQPIYSQGHRSAERWNEFNHTPAQRIAKAQMRQNDLDKGCRIKGLTRGSATLPTCSALLYKVMDAQGRTAGDFSDSNSALQCARSMSGFVFKRNATGRYDLHRINKYLQ